MSDERYDDIMDATCHALQIDTAKLALFKAEAERMRVELEREAIRLQHPDWTEDMIDAHMALTAPVAPPAPAVPPGGIAYYTGNPTGPAGHWQKWLDGEWAVKLDAAPEPTPATPSPVQWLLDRWRSFRQR